MPMTDLPPEILSHIVKQFSVYDLTESRINDIDSIKAATLVNKTWHALSVPILYHKINMAVGSTSDMRERAEFYFQLMDTKTGYYKHIRHLRIVFSSPDLFELQVFLHVLERCEMVNVLSLEGDVDFEDCEILMDCIKSMGLSRLNLRNIYAYGFLIEMLIDAQFSSLRVLTVGDNIQYSDSHIPSCLAHSEVEELSLDADYWDISSIESLVRWPKRLKVLRLLFTLSTFILSEDEDDSAIPVIQSLLEIHQESLEIIELISRPDNAMGEHVVNFSSYMNLKSLILHKCDLFDISPKDVSSKLPSGLENLEIGPPHQDSQPREVIALDEYDSGWLEDFCAIRKETIPNHKLRSLKINFVFNDSAIAHCPLTGYIEDEDWPCQSLDDAASSLESFRIVLTYPIPYVTKVGWQNMIQEQTVPGWEYYTTKEERKAVVPATSEEYSHHTIEYGHTRHGDDEYCTRIHPLPYEIIMPTELTITDGQNCGKICSYFSTSCKHPSSVRRAAPCKETKEARTQRQRRNTERGFICCHDVESPSCAESLAEERRWQDFCDRD